MKKFLCVFMNDYRIRSARRALELLEERFPGEFSGKVFSASQVNQSPALEAELLSYACTADMACITSHGSIQGLHCFPALWKLLEGKCPVYFASSMGEETAELMPKLLLSPDAYHSLHSYYQAGEPEDLLHMMLCAYNLLWDGSYTLLPPSPSEKRGIYLGGGKMLPPEQEAEYKEAMCREKRCVIGVVIHDHYTQTGNLAHIDALLRAIEERGCVAYAVADSFTSDPKSRTGILYRMEAAYRREDAGAIPSALVLSYGFSLTAMSGELQAVCQPPTSVLEAWDLPVIQALTTYYSPREYEENIRGLDMVSIPFSVYQPEFDGQLISVPYAATISTPDGGKVCTPLPDRVQRVAELACRWGALRHTPIREKKLAIIFHNMPPRNDTIGSAHGLDSPESVYQIVKALSANGLSLAHSFESGAQIIAQIQAAVTNDGQWLSCESALQRAAATVDASLYKAWFQRLNADTQRELIQCWGDAPGTVMVHDNRIVIPGILNGNLFLGLQPMRSSPEKAEELYHSTDSTPPHSYLAFYRWIDEVFQADAVIHVGTHGTLEWLPGKEIGLSSGCYSDICIGSIPHLYLYNINILGEGIQAKRRSYACILDHMVPSMDESDTYGGLSDLDAAIDEYYHALQASPAQAADISARILDMAQEQELLADLKMSRADMAQNPAVGIERLHRWISKIKTSMVRDGLHVYGQCPTGRLRDQLARLLVRIPNGKIPALNDAILLAQGWDPEQLRDAPQLLYPDGRTALRIQEDAIPIARQLFAALAEKDYREAAVDAVVAAQNFSASTAALKKVLAFVCSEVIPKIDHTGDEMEFLCRGLDGRFVPPLPGGNPSRGNVHILPTGRNFYAIDPTAVPSRGAWAIGKVLAEQAIAAYRAQENTEPESIAMVVYADAAMKTHGEDIAEAFALMGVRPVYLGQTNKVVGVEPIPPEELGRPRIDVVLRISGLFRDTFPNVVELVERAVLTVVALDEDESQNYIKKHSRQEMERLMEEGLSPNDAAERANLRVFGCPSGTYGAGVNQAIHSRSWESWEDLSRLYALWSCHGYSSRFHGEALESTFRRQLSTVSVTIKNESSIEGDLLDSDDYYNYHGGLIACVHESSGKKPLALAGQTADPQRPETSDVSQELARVMRSRILNPKWVAGLQRHGYKGAQDIAKAFDVFFGWDATAQTAENWMYTAVARQLLLEPSVRQWMEEVNPAAVHHMSERLLEAEQRGMWQAEEATLQAVRQIYMNAEGSVEDLFQ